MKEVFMMAYEKWEGLTLEQRMSALTQCVSFYDEKAVEYVTANLPKAKKAKFSKEPCDIVLNDIQRNGKDISFGDNVVYVTTDAVVGFDKKELFFSISKSTICAVFISLFKNTASDPNRKTQFSSVINGYFASITNEFLAGQGFEADMMAALEASLPALVSEIGMEMGQ